MENPVQELAAPETANPILHGSDPLDPTLPRYFQNTRPSFPWAGLNMLVTIGTGQQVGCVIDRKKIGP
jgi:hypothetical protein